MSTFTTTTTATKPTNKQVNKSGKEQTASLPEHLSALLDDEAGSFEQQRVLNELKKDDNLASKLSTYALIGETLRSGKPAVTVGADFLSGIHEQLDSEPVYSTAVLENTTNTNDSNNKNSWLRPVGGFAMAASVAALAVIGFQNYFNKSDNGFTQPAGAEIVAAKSIQGDALHIKNDRLTQAQMDAAVVVSADQLQTTQVNTTQSDTAMMLAKTEVKSARLSDNNTTYRQADARTRSLLKRYVDSHMQYASTTTFVPSVRVIAYSDF